MKIIRETAIAIVLLAVSAQLYAQKAEHVLEHNWMYYGNKTQTISIATDLQKDARLELEITSDKKELCDRLYADAKAGKDTVTYSFKLKPGFYTTTVKLGDKTLSSKTIGVNPEKIKSPQDRPADFVKFWKQAWQELAAVDPEYKLTPDEKNSGKLRKCYVVEMKSYGGVSIKGILYEPVKEGKYPVILTYHGYGTAADKDWCKVSADSNPELIEFQLNVREQGINWRKDRDNKWISKGIADKDTYYYKGAFLDAVRGLDFIWSRENVDHSRVYAEGASQGGALTFVATALDCKFGGRRFKKIAPYEPFLSDFPDYLQIAKWPTNDIRARQQQENISDDQVLATLAYYDVKNFTTWIKCPVFMAIGLQDVTCPPHTNFAGYNMVRTSKSYVVYPFNGHNVHLNKEWLKKMNEWLLK